MDYKELLKKYIKATEDTEGVSFEYFISGYAIDVKFTEEEKAELKTLSDLMLKGEE